MGRYTTQKSVLYECVVNVLIFLTRQREAKISMPACAVERNINITACVISTNTANRVTYIMKQRNGNDNSTFDNIR